MNYSLKVTIRTILRHLVPRTHFSIGTDINGDYTLSFWRQWVLITWDHTVISLKQESINFVR